MILHSISLWTPPLMMAHLAKNCGRQLKDTGLGEWGEAVWCMPALQQELRAMNSSGLNRRCWSENENHLDQNQTGGRNSNLHKTRQNLGMFSTIFLPQLCVRFFSQAMSCLAYMSNYTAIVYVFQNQSFYIYGNIKFKFYIRSDFTTRQHSIFWN